MVNVPDDNIREEENFVRDIEGNDSTDHDNVSLSSDGDYVEPDPSNKKEKAGSDAVAGNQAKDVRNMKVLIFIVIIMSITGAVAVYFQSKIREQKLFEKQFRYDADKVLEATRNSVEAAFGTLDTLGTSIVALAEASNQTFPFVTIPRFGVLAAKAQQTTGVICTYLLPIVKFNQRLEWEQYSAGNNSYIGSWVENTLELQDNYTQFYGPMPQNKTYETSDVLYSDFGDIPYNESRPDRLDVYLPEWHKFPLVMTSYYPANWDFYSQQYTQAYTNVMTKKKAVLYQPSMIPQPDNQEAMAEAELWCEFYQDYIPPGKNCMEPITALAYPIVRNLDQIEIAYDNLYPDSYEVKAILASDIYWRDFISGILPPGSRGIVMVFENACVNDAFTYQIDGPEVKYLGVGDLHDTKYDQIYITTTLQDLQAYREGTSGYTGLPIDQDHCGYTFHVYPSDEMKEQFGTNTGIIFAFSAAAFIIFPFLAFLVYDYKVSRHQARIIHSADRSNAIIASLFPERVRAQLLRLHDDGNRLPDTGDGNTQSHQSSAPIAELYTDTTVLFADIANFTVWSSVRDPNQVFTLLEKLYGAFDEIAERRRIFKVETIGDCYVAVSGLPDPRKDHAVAMVKFAKEMLLKMATVTSRLETVLGPGTSALSARVGLNSGPTTAGVLRGAKGRFQIFGDTVNTAARMQSNSYPGKIMCTEKTKEILVKAGKQHWVNARPDLVDAKGKGAMQCYWCDPYRGSEVSVGSSPSDQSVSMLSRDSHYLSKSAVENNSLLDDKIERQVKWISGMLEHMLMDLLSIRDNFKGAKSHFDDLKISPRDEISETLLLPNRSQTNCRNDSGSNQREISVEVRIQLRQYVYSIAKMYRNNPFHSFHHACHVIMGTKKLLARMTKPIANMPTSAEHVITSDPLTQFAILLSALVHDVDHPGVSNAQLVIEQTDTAVIYSNKSVSEQNSVTIAWELLMEPQYEDLRKTVMPSSSDRKLFRQVLINSVMATDLFDADLKMFRENRWSKVFDKSEALPDEESNLRSAIVIEHIIQASDVIHTMQHWHVYQQWNKRLFQEMYSAYVAGRAGKDPSLGWYEGELWFFDNYIIPLAKKLKTCGVFGVSCDELLDYAVDNRAEWAVKGKDIVANLVLEVVPSNLCTEGSGSESDADLQNEIELTSDSKPEVETTYVVL